jgi:hypothetical protein
MGLTSVKARTPIVIAHLECGETELKIQRGGASDPETPSRIALFDDKSK